MKRFGSLLRAENVAFALFLAFMLIYPSRTDEFGVLNAAYFLALTLLALSLAMIWGKAGILSFGQTAFFGVGGYLYGIYTLNVLGSGATWVGVAVGVLAGGLVAAVLGYFMFYGGVNDVFVGLTTLALTLVLQTFMAQTAGPEWTVGEARLNGYNGMYVPQISVGDAPLYGRPLYFLYLAIVIAVYLLLRWLSSTRWGYGLLALQENRPRTESFGYNVRLMQVQVFALAGCVAALSGVLYASWGGYIDPSSMGLTAAITPVIYVAIGGRRNLTAAMISSMILLKLSQTLASTAPEYALVIFGVLALVAVLFVPEGFMAALFTAIDRLVFRRRTARPELEPGPTAADPEGRPDMAEPTPAGEPLLVLNNVSKRFGGLTAVADLDLVVQRGELRCLIGPNGAGKSTVFKLIMGFERPTSGTIAFGGANIAQWPTWRRARHGLSVKMQIPGIYPELTVHDNMRVAAQNHVPVDRMDEAIDRLLERVGLGGLGPEPAKNLSHGQQQWLEIGMALSVNPTLLLLDEPTAGMGPGETEATARLVESLNADGVTIMVIEHDMTFVRQIARTVTVMNLGRLFAEGTIAEIEAHQGVTDIYLGRT